MSENQLIKKCIRGDEHAQKELFMTHSPALFQAAMRYCTSKEDAEDVLQDAWVDIFHALPKYVDRGKLTSWMKTIVIHRALRSLRNRKVLVDLDEAGGMHLAATGQYFSEVRDIHTAVETLPEGYREILKLYVFDRYSHAEIGDMLGINPATSRAKLTMARNKLRIIIEEQNRIKSYKAV